MKRTLQILAVLTLFTCTHLQAEEDLLYQAGRACVFGAAALGVTSVIVLYPAMVVGATNVPTGSLIIGNILFGCGISALGSTIANSYDQVYSKLFPETEESVKEPEASPQIDTL